MLSFGVNQGYVFEGHYYLVKLDERFFVRNSGSLTKIDTLLRCYIADNYSELRVIQYKINT